MPEVRWQRSAVNELADVWLHADSAERDEITRATAIVDHRLGNDPHNEGESRPGGRRIIFVAPLAVIFRISSDRRTVSVLHIRMFRKRKS